MEGESQGASNNKDSQHTKSTCVSLLAKDLYLELLIIQHRASLKLMMLNGGQAHHHHRFMQFICNFGLNCTLITSHIKIDIDIIRWFNVTLFWPILVTESEILGRIKKNKVSKAVFLIQKALLVYTDKGTNDSKNQIKSLLEVPKHSLMFVKNPPKHTNCDNYTRVV